MKSRYKSESRNFTFKVEKSYTKAVIDFNFGIHKDLSILKVEYQNCLPKLKSMIA